MADRIYLHIGAMKSATTHLQGLLDANATSLERAGVHWPGSRLNFAAVGDLLGQHSQRKPGSWQQLEGQIRAYDGPVLISNELLSIRRTAGAKRLADRLGTPLEVIVTARDLVRVIPAQWSTSAENGRPTPWPEFVEALTRDDRQHPDVHRFWRRQDLPAIVRAWSAVSAGPVRLVTVPGPGGGADVIVSRFLSVLGLDATALDHPPPPAPRGNPGEPSIPLTEEQLAWARRRAKVMVRRLQRLPVDLVGDWTDLAP